MLTLLNAQDIRELASATMTTFTKMGPEQDWIAVILKEGGQGYNGKAMALKDLKKKVEEDGTEPADLADLGPLVLR